MRFRLQKYLIPFLTLFLILAFLPLASGCGEEDSEGSQYDELIQQLGSEDQAQRQQAVDELAAAGEPAVEPVIAVFTGEVQSQEMLTGARDVLVRIGEPAIQPLVDSLAYTGEKSATAAAWKKKALVEIGQPALEPLIIAVGDEDLTKRVEAADALGEMGDDMALDVLLALLADPEERARVQAADSLGALGDAEAIIPLDGALKDESAEVRKAAREALAAINEVVDDPRLKQAFDTCIQQELAPYTDPYGLIIGPDGAMVNPEVLFGLTDDQKLALLSIHGECVMIIR